MKGWLKTILVAAMVGVLALATVAVAQTDSSESEEAPRTAEERKARAEHFKDRRDKRHREGCGKRIGPKARQLVYNETKFQTEDGFALRQMDVGEVTAASASGISIKRADGEIVRATGNDETRVCYNGKKGSLEDIQVGDRAVLHRMTSGDETVLKAVMAGTPGESDEAPASQSSQRQDRPLELLDA